MRKALFATLAVLALTGGFAVAANTVRTLAPTELAPASALPAPAAEAPPVLPPPGVDSLLQQEVLNCNQFPNPRCNPNTDPNCFCDDECDPFVDPECVLCEDKCSGPRIDPIG
jgi:hypothetical protein